MTRTPWGPSETLDVRTRLLAATVEVVAAKGARGATVAGVIETAGVSRATFYKHFPDKRACMLATVDALARSAGRLVEAEVAEDGPWERRLRAALDTLVVQIESFPDAVRLCLVDLWELGPAATAVNERAIARVEAPFRNILAESPERNSMPPEIVRAIVGGVYKSIHGRVRRREQETIAALSGDLATWGVSFRPPTTPIRRPRGTAATAPGQAGPQFAAHGQAGRLFEACVAEVAERGYDAVTVDGLARRARMSLRTVYSLFGGGKEEILLATYDAGVAQGEAVAMPAYARHRDSWPHAVRAALGALLAYLAGDVAWARMSIVEAIVAGDQAMERSDRVIDSYAALLKPGLQHNPDLAPIALEATAGAVYTLIYEQVLRDPTALPEIVPLCTYVALAPFVGPDEALTVANDGGRHPRPPRDQTVASDASANRSGPS